MEDSKYFEFRFHSGKRETPFTEYFKICSLRLPTSTTYIGSTIASTAFLSTNFRNQFVSDISKSSWQRSSVYLEILGSGRSACLSNLNCSARSILKVSGRTFHYFKWCRLCSFLLNVSSSRALNRARELSTLDIRVYPDILLARDGLACAS